MVLTMALAGALELFLATEVIDSSGAITQLSPMSGGDENITSTIVVNGRETQVTRNLEAALRAFRGRPDFEGRFKLWVDALCINQADYEEREHLVRKMQNIYGNAWTVMAWLGKEEIESEKAINLIEALSSAGGEGRGQELERKLTETPNYLGSGCWLALHKLIQRPYWTLFKWRRSLISHLSSLTSSHVSQVMPIPKANTDHSGSFLM